MSILVTFFDETENFSEKNGALRWIILVGNKRNVQKPRYRFTKSSGPQRRGVGITKCPGLQGLSVYKVFGSVEARRWLYKVFGSVGVTCRSVQSVRTRRDGPYMLANSTNFGDFYPTDYIMSYLSEADDLTNFSKICQSKISFAELASRRNVTFFLLSILSHGYPQGFFCYYVWLAVSMMSLLHTMQNVSALKEKTRVRFPIVEKNQMHGVTPGPINQNCSIKSLPSCPSGGHSL